MTSGEPHGPGGVQATGNDPQEVLAREHAPRLFRLALRLTGRREDAEDLVQETFLRTWRTMGSLEGRAPGGAYLVRALVNLWKNRLRSRARSRLVAWLGGERDPGGAGSEWTPADGGPSPYQRLESRDRGERIRHAVAQLEPHRRLALLLREVEEMSYEEIAATTGVPVGTVRSRIARAREELRELLGSMS